MKILKYLGNFCKSIWMIIVYFILQALITVIFGFIFTTKETMDFTEAHPTWSNEEVNNALEIYFESDIYAERMAQFLVDNTILILILTIIFILPIIVHQYRKINKDKKLNNPINKKDILNLTIIGSSLALFLNMVITIINRLMPVEEAVTLDKNIFISIIGVGILGPIIEELLFRGILYNKLQKFNSKKISIILTTLIFGLIHMNIIQAIYAGILGLLFLWVYDYHKNIKAPIITHMACNTIIVILSFLLAKINILGAIILSVIMLFIFIFTFLKEYKSKLKKNDFWS